MVVHDLIKVLGPTQPEPNTPELMLKHLPPEQMARMLVGLLDDIAKIASAAYELERNADYERPSGTFDLVEAIKQLHSRFSSACARARTEKYKQFAVKVRPFWNSDRHNYHNNERWAEAALTLPIALKFMKKHVFKVSSETIAKWPNRYRWNPEAKKRSVS